MLNLMKIAYFEADLEEAKVVQERLVGQEAMLFPKELSEQYLPEEAKAAEIVSIFVDTKITKHVLDQLPNLKMIATRSTGFDHIDMEECKQRGIVVCNVPTYGEHTVAEHTFALILALSRKIFQSYERTERRRFNREGLMGFDLFGKTLGVVGTGNIGRNVVKIGLGIGMKVRAFDVQANPAFQAEAAKLGDFLYVKTLEELLGCSDVITLHVPFIPATRHMINKQNVQAIKRGALLVNTARGGIVDTEALLWALGEKVLAGAGLDVLEEEGDMFDDLAVLSRGIPAGKDIQTLLRNHLLIAHEDVIITPHNAFNSREAVGAIFDTTINNILGWVNGTPQNQVVKG